MQRCSFEGIVSRDFFPLSFFSWIIFPKPLKITWGSFWIFSRIHRDIRKSRCTTGINDTGSKFAIGTAGVADTGGKFTSSVVAPAANFPLVLLITVANLPLVANNGNNIRLLAPQSELHEFTCMLTFTQRLQTIYLELSDCRFCHLHLELRISPRIFEKIWNGLMNT